MSKKTILSDAASGKEIVLHKDADGYTVEQKQHVKEVWERNLRARNAYEPNSLIGNTQRHHQQVAEIPNVLYWQLRQKFGSPQQNPKDWFRWLNDPENRAFRSGGGWL